MKNKTTYDDTEEIDEILENMDDEQFDEICYDAEEYYFELAGSDADETMHRSECLDYIREYMGEGDFLEWLKVEAGY